MASSNIKLLSFSGNVRILHLSWIAFFISFVVWFNHAPLLASIRETFQLTDGQVKALLTLNVALTIPVRILIGMLVDKFGPRIMYSVLLAVCGGLCFFFALANSYEQLALARLLLGCVGAGFVIGIRLISEWFPAKQVGFAEGIYGGWGNFGSAAAALSLPVLAHAFGGPDAWRWAVGVTGVISIIYSVIFYALASDTPKGSTYFRPKKLGAMEVTSKSDFWLYVFLYVPMTVALLVLTWKLSPAGFKLIDQTTTNVVYVALLALFAWNVWQVIDVNRNILAGEVVPQIHRYKFKQVAILSGAYAIAFGSEIAVVSMLPLYFKDMYNLTLIQAGLVGSSFAIMNLFARPAGGLISDRFGRKRTMTIVMIGITFGYFGMSFMGGMPLWAAVTVTVINSFFVQAGCGAVYGIIPLIKRRLTGQIAGMSGAYGNVGSVVFLTVLSFVTPSTFFMVIAASALVVLGLVQFLDEPSGQMAEIMPDGSVQMIDVT
ncbi:NarK family nitrate/nitrite MFS transporter [Plasticicumulans sp.]|uniref:NarK family nitrate/nitrite MFS transporter n=1 Tax=Plasticicumulans sp. TaxID=2307179 RepID=UPI002B61C5B8|nr:NarK family nitrate/nitrite MFS transporter [Plasticicumulans sp.]MBS0601268.1 NarK family nitrate/nitrite MFS transporter [Pseudomonadota bacterium]HMV37757.1 NarK family nitrate/nitrite MFS transporter [Plasticicumulans sp.]HMW29935.1 NarK family nitrate/nitrite MFS transporter [Plasticicumulans sp.]HMW40863.1 NarK family nitrate/nitrite MFS transporter [Plasticicumulans sp.]HMX52305.1 NarK family nitrate/nitrite MFS transporter [Plasticicumulans sp.]